MKLIAPLIVCFIQAADANPFDRTTYERWVGFKVGSYASFRTTMTINGKEANKDEFVEKVIAVEDTVIVISDRNKTNPRKEKFKSAVTPPPENVKGAKVETLAVADTSFECKVVVEESKDSTTTTWWCEKAPGKVVKRVSKAPNGNETITELLKPSESIEIGGKRYNCAVIRVKHSAKEAPITTTWYNSKVPGGVVLREQERNDASGKSITRDELIDMKSAD